jgi:hypothetical protein
MGSSRRVSYLLVQIDSSRRRGAILVAGFGSEQVAGFRLECMAGFVGTVNPVNIPKKPSLVAL